MAYADGPRIFILNINDMYNETIQATDDSTEEHSITVNGLFPDYKYTFRILAGNSLGSGEFSHPLTIKTPTKSITGRKLPTVSQSNFTEDRRAVCFYVHDIEGRLDKFLFRIQIRSNPVQRSEWSFLIMPLKSGLNCIRYYQLFSDKSRHFHQTLIAGANSFDIRKFQNSIGLDWVERRHFGPEDIVSVSVCHRELSLLCSRPLEIGGDRFFSIDNLALLALVVVTAFGIFVCVSRRFIKKHLLVMATINPLTMAQIIFVYLRAKFF
jgi:hypothetical protein